MSIIQLFFLVALLFASPAKAQVNIGSKNPPQPFSILEIATKEKEGGLRLPQLKTEEREALTSQLKGDDAARGLVVFDTDLDCLEFWNGEKWISLCSDIIPPPVDPSTLNLGSGTLTGRTCFDIAESNDNGESGPLSGRTWKADFALIHTQNYIFTSSGVTKNVRYVIEDPKGVLSPSQPLYGLLKADNVPDNTSIPLTLEFKNTLNSPSSDPKIVGLTRENADSVVINIIYTNDEGKDVKVPLIARVQDCSCCGAYVSDTEWKPFMCYNLGVTNYDADPFTPSKDLNGDYYQWGSNTPCATVDTPNAAISGWDIFGPGSSYYGNEPVPGSYPKDITEKSSTDPCPTGYRVPNYNEWLFIQSNTTLNPSNPVPAPITTWYQYGWSGMMFGNSLFLPAAGQRQASDGMLGNRGMWGNYWSCSVSGGSYANMMNYTNDGTSFGDNTIKGTGLSIRCIAE